jgi:hypothetical protein
MPVTTNLGWQIKTRTKNRGNVAERYGYSFRPFWDGQPVQVTKKGHFSIFISPDQPNLQLSGGRPLARAIENSTEPTTIHFSMDHISLECGGRVIYQKSRDSLKIPRQGNSGSSKCTMKTRARGRLKCSKREGGRECRNADGRVEEKGKQLAKELGA